MTDIFNKQSLPNSFSEIAKLRQFRILIEPAEEYTQRVLFQNRILEELGLIQIPRASFDANSYSLEEYQTPFKDQLDRGTCWAFAGVAALEAAYKRKYGITLDLSEQYVFHINKCGELFPNYTTNSVDHENNTSFTGFQGSSAIIRNMARFAVPEEHFSPYKSQSELETIRLSIPEAGSLNWDTSTQEQFDAFEFSEQHIPLIARQNAKYRVKTWAALGNNSTPEAIEQVIRSGYEVVADVRGHCLLIVGYDRNRRVFIIKNSWGENKFIELSYDDSHWPIIGGHYITDVTDPDNSPQTKASWLGYWNMDHDGWRGKLVIRRFTNFRSPDKDAPTKLGNYYRDDQRYDVNGYFINGGRGIVFHIADNTSRIEPGALIGQRFEMSIFSGDPTKAAGKTTWRNTPFGSILSRNSIPGRYSSSFNRNEWIGNWSMEHDGWPGTLSIRGFSTLPFPFFNLINIDASYTASNGKVFSVTGTISSSSMHVALLNIKFSDQNNQRFEIMYHTWENKVFSGVTYWNGIAFGVQGFKQ